MRLRFVYNKNKKPFFLKKKIGLILHSISKEKDLNFVLVKIFDKRRSFFGEYCFMIETELCDPFEESFRKEILLFQQDAIEFFKSSEFRGFHV